jgi:glycosyltransferase involved in cell wall biosynthesis
MACGLPVVAYDLPVLREVYPKGVVRVAIGDKKSFSRAIIELLSDEKKHLEMSNWARKTSEKFSWEKSVGKILDNLQTRVNV